MAVGVQAVEAQADTPSLPQAPAPDPFAAYVTPGECGRIAARVDHQYWFTHRPDTLTPTPLYAPRARTAVAAAGRCAVRFRIATTASRDLLGLGQALLGAEQWVQADSAFERWLGLLAARPAGERRWAMVQIVRAYLEARPARLIEAAGYIDRLDALGPSAAPERLLAHLAVMRLARHMDSTALQAAHVGAAIMASRELRGEAAVRYLGASSEAYTWLTDLYGRRDSLAQVYPILDSAEARLRKWCPSVTFDDLKAGYTLPSWGMPVPALQVSRWFNDSTDGHRPAPGRRSLIFFPPEVGCSDLTCFARYAMLRRLLARYPDLDVTFVTATRGGYRTHLLSPDAEMEGYRRQLFDEDKLPGALGVWQTTWRRRAVDHGLDQDPNPNDEQYHNVLGQSSAVLIDRRGVVRMVYDFTPETEIRWRNVIGEMP
jgi:hypothetical protein